MENTIKTYLFIGGNQDGLSVPLQPDLESVELSAGVTGKDNYVYSRDTRLRSMERKRVSLPYLN